MSPIPTDHDNARETVALIKTALQFCNSAAGEGLEIDALCPEEFLMRYSDAAGFEDWDHLGDHIADQLSATIERCERLEKALSDMVSVAAQDGWEKAMTGRQLILKIARAALTSGEDG